MQVKIKDEEQPKQFYPFTLEIRVESLEELANLWCRFNCDGRTVKDRNKGQRAEKIMPFSSSGNTQIWEVLNVKANEFNIGDGY